MCLQSEEDPGTLGSSVPVTQHPAGPDADHQHSAASGGATGPTETHGALCGQRESFLLLFVFNWSGCVSGPHSSAEKLLPAWDKNDEPVCLGPCLFNALCKQCQQGKGKSDKG